MQESEQRRLRAEYTRLRSAAMKRVKRGREAGFADLPQLQGVEYLLPPLRSLPKDTTQQELTMLVAEAQAFLSKPTTIKRLRESAAQLAQQTADNYRAFATENLRLFDLFLREADARVVDKIWYAMHKAPTGAGSVSVQELVREVKAAYEEWKRNNPYWVNYLS